MLELTDESKARIKAVIEAPEPISFGEVAKIAGLDVTKDLRHSDLSGCDFSGDDLRGWNLTGCDLRGAKGINVIWDATTILTDADLEGSIFDVATQSGGA